MRNQKDIEVRSHIKDQSRILLTEKVIWQIRGMKEFFFVPFIIMFILQPVYIIVKLRVGYGFGVVYVADAIEGCVFCAYPALSLWWSLWLLRRYLEEEDRELYYIDGKIKWYELSFYYKIFLAVTAVILLIYTKWTGIVLGCYMFICVAALSYFYHAAAYCLAYASKSATFVLMLLLFYTFWVMTPFQYGTSWMNYLQLFYGGRLKGLLSCFALFAAGAALVKWGKRLNQRYCSY